MTTITPYVPNFEGYLQTLGNVETELQHTVEPLASYELISQIKLVSMNKDSKWLFKDPFDSLMFLNQQRPEGYAGFDRLRYENHQIKIDGEDAGSYHVLLSKGPFEKDAVWDFLVRTDRIKQIDGNQYGLAGHVFHANADFRNGALQDLGARIEYDISPGWASKMGMRLTMKRQDKLLEIPFG